MEDKVIHEWLSYGDGSGNGYGYGYGDGYGNGSGYSYGYGYGDGYGYGNGDGYGNGNGYGDGSGNGYGDCYGKGYGDGDGEGKGYGDGDGYGDGNGNGIAEINGEKIFIVDDTPTILHSIHGNVARASTVRALQFIPCYVARYKGYFAHGETIRKAMADAVKKWQDDRSDEERCKMFIEKFPTLDTIACNRKLYEWHSTLTGSCEFGRNEFVKTHNVDLEGFTSVRDFIALVKNSYGGEIVKKLEKMYKATN